MYPFIRLLKDMLLVRNQPPLKPSDVHVSHHICWPWDLDFQAELNNGRALSIYDLGRIPASVRLGLLRIMRQNGWGFAMAGASVRYRRRVTAFARIRMTTQAVGRDARFIYLVQTMWVKGEAASNILYRSALTSKNGIVPTQQVTDAMGEPDWNPELPEWVQAWIEAEDKRPWPPEV